LFEVTPVTSNKNSILTQSNRSYSQVNLPNADFLRAQILVFVLRYCVKGQDIRSAEVFSRGAE